MTIHDELILELIKPNRLGEVGEGALIIKVVGTKEIHYKLEESTHDYYLRTSALDMVKESVKMTPDVTVEIPHEHKEVAIELENDISWDFGKSLQQVKKYKIKFKDTRVIIPEEYKRFAPLYKHEGFRVYLWNAMRKWHCLRCGAITEKEGPVQPKCKCKNKSRNDFRLVGVKEADVEEFV